MAGGLLQPSNLAAMVYQLDRPDQMAGHPHLDHRREPLRLERKCSSYLTMNFSYFFLFSLSLSLSLSLSFSLVVWFFMPSHPILVWIFYSYKIHTISSNFCTFVKIQNICTEGTNSVRTLGSQFLSLVLEPCWDIPRVLPSYRGRIYLICDSWYRACRKYCYFIHIPSSKRKEKV